MHSLDSEIAEKDGSSYWDDSVEYGLKLDMDDKSIDEYQNCPSFVLSDEEWENRRYEIAKEIYINKFSDYSIENAELALMAADDFIGVLRKYYQNKD